MNYIGYNALAIALVVCGTYLMINNIEGGFWLIVFSLFAGVSPTSKDEE